MNRPIWDNPNFIQGNLLPDYPSSYNIGSEERPFKDLWLSGDIHLTGDIYIDEVLLGDGSAADPSLSFQLDQDTGFYRVGANEIGVAIGGVQRTTFDTYGQTVVLNSALSGRPGLTITNQSTSTAARAGIALYNNLGQQGSLYITSSPGPGAGDLYIDVDAGREINFAHGGTVAAHVDTTGIAAISGTAAAPSYAFLDDTNTGIYSVAADQLNITTGGANRLSVANTFIGIASGLQLYAPGTGTAAAPDYTFNGDVNTGVYRVGADNLGIAAGGAQVAGFNTGGVYTTGAGRFLSIDGTAAVPAYSFNSDGNTGLFWAGTDGLGLAAGGVEGFRVFTVGGVAYARVAPGSVSIPGLSFLNDTDTGIYSVTTNRIGFSAGGSLAFEAANYGSGGLLQINVGTSTNPGIGFAGGTNTGIYQAGGVGTLSFTNSGTEYYRWDATRANFGIPNVTTQGRMNIYESVSATATILNIGNSNTPSSANNRRINFCDGGGTVEGSTKFTWASLVGYRFSGANEGSLQVRARNGSGTADVLVAEFATANINLASIVDFTATMGNSTKDPTSDAPADWVQVEIGGTTYYLPAYVA